MTSGLVFVRAGRADAFGVSGLTQTSTKSGEQIGLAPTCCLFGSARWADFFVF
jgi:hypothetical protein